MDRAPDSLDDLESGYEGVAEFYDLFTNNDDLPFYIEYAKKQGSPILDVAAGTGRVSLELAEAGFEVHCIERSPSMLSIFRKKIRGRESSKHITLHEGDMADFQLNVKYPLIIIPSSFGHALTKERQLSTLTCIKDHLIEGGIFILDTYVGERIDEHSSFQDQPVSLSDGRIVQRFGEMSVDPERRLMKLTLRFEVLDAEGAAIEERIVHSGTAVITSLEVDMLIRAAGFEVLAEFGDFEEAPYTPMSSRRILILTK